MFRDFLVFVRTYKELSGRTFLPVYTATPLSIQDGPRGMFVVCPCGQPLSVGPPTFGGNGRRVPVGGHPLTINERMPDTPVLWCHP